MSFELANASQDLTFQKVQESVKKGDITTAADYGEACERIEYDSARLRARASLEMIRAGRWNEHNDPLLKNFMEKGTKLRYGFNQEIVGTGKWLEFTGYYQTQLLIGHTQTYIDRFPTLPQREEYLKVKAAKDRYLERKGEAPKTGDEAPKAGTGASSSGAGAPKAVKYGPMQKVVDPSSFLAGEELGRIWQGDAVGKTFRGVDGNQYYLSTMMEGTFYFKKVLTE
jgi:hypothetical protein